MWIENEDNLNIHYDRDLIYFEDFRGQCDMDTCLIENSSVTVDELSPLHFYRPSVISQLATCC
jgi:hypothetical protein